MFLFILQVLVPFFVMVPVQVPDQTWSRSLVPVPVHHISGRGLGPGPVIFLVPALVPVPVNFFGPVTQCARSDMMI